MDHHQHRANEELLDTQRGIWVVKVTFGALLITALAQGVVTFISGSAALFADTVHGLSNALTTLPLWIAFSLGRKRATSQFPYGYHRAEDLAGVLILLFIAVSGAIVGYESIRKLLVNQTPQNLPWAMSAGAAGFLTNEAIAQYRIKVGKEIGSATLIADGHHARVDGLGSLAVVLGLLAVVLGFPIADPVAGLAITGLIIYLLIREAGPAVLSRVMDRIDSAIVAEIQVVAAAVPGVLSAHDVRARWVGHRLVSELSISVDAGWTVAQGHHTAERVHHQLLHSVSKLIWCTVHVEPFETGQAVAHQIIAHHFDEDSEDLEEAADFDRRSDSGGPQSTPPPREK